MAGGTKDRLDRLEERTERIEQTLGRVDDVLGGFEKEAAPSRSVCARLEDLTLQILEARSLVEVLAAKIQELAEELNALKEAGAPSGTTGRGTTVKFPEPSSFSGVRDAKELENFLWDMDQYLIAAKIPKREQVPLVGMYLSGDAKLWWRSRQVDDARAGRENLSSWEELKKELRDQFLPGDASWAARVALSQVRQTGTVREYVRAFTALMLDITDMSEEDKLFNFLRGLEQWAQVELRRRGAKDLPTAIAHAEALMDYRVAPVSSRDKGKARLKEGKPAERRDLSRESRDGKSRDTAKSRDSSVESKSGGSAKPWGCFICNGPHRARECPARENVATLVTMEDSEEEPASLSPLQLQ